VGTAEQLSSDAPFATRLWGEPMVLYRDTDGEIVCARDVCPHRSAPLSMGELKDGELRCFYHGWAFGAGGRCVDVPTIQDSRRAKLGSNCATVFAVVEVDGLIWVWRGNPLAADVRKLPRPLASQTAHTIDTVLDYACDWSQVVEKNLASPYLHWLQDGNMETAANGRQVKVTRFEAPNVVRHCGALGFSEEMHTIPIAPHRTRLILRQHLPKGPILSSLLQLPGAAALLDLLVKNWNYHMSLEDARDATECLDATGQATAASRSERAGSATIQAGVAQEGIDRFWEWKATAEQREGQPYFTRWDGTALKPKYGPQTADDGQAGTYGLKKTYVQDTPLAEFAPLNYAPYKHFVDRCEVAITALASAVSVPAVVATWKTIGPALAAFRASHVPS